jgi:hypothetical protein
METNYSEAYEHVLGAVAELRKARRVLGESGNTSTLAMSIKLLENQIMNGQAAYLQDFINLTANR